MFMARELFFVGEIYFARLEGSGSLDVGPWTAGPLVVALVRSRLGHVMLVHTTLMTYFHTSPFTSRTCVKLHLMSGSFLSDVTLGPCMRLGSLPWNAPVRSHQHQSGMGRDDSVSERMVICYRVVTIFWVKLCNFDYNLIVPSIRLCTMLALNLFITVTSLPFLSFASA